MNTRIYLKSHHDGSTFGGLEPNTWFLDEDGDLCLKIEPFNGTNTIYFGRSHPGFLNYNDDHPVTPKNISLVEDYQP